MTKAPRENRVPIMMSNEEIAWIDDWRFKNRIATRSDAVRRLLEIASWFEAGREGLLERAADLRSSFEDTLESYDHEVEEVAKMNLHPRVAAAVDDAKVNIGSLFDEFVYVEMHLRLLDDLVQKVTLAPTRDAARTAAQEARDAAERTFNEYVQRIEEKRDALERRAEKLTDEMHLAEAKWPKTE